MQDDRDDSWMEELGKKDTLQDNRNDSRVTWMVELGADTNIARRTETTAGWWSWGQIQTLQDDGDDSWKIELGTDTHIARRQR